MTDQPDPPARPPRSNPRDRARDELLAALDARARRLNDVVTEHADLLGQALPRIDTLRERVGELTGRVDELAGVEPAPPPPNPPVHWPALSADAALVEWERLGAWVADVLGPWYQITRGQLPDCWPMHRRAVLALSWLRAAYVAAYSPAGRPDAAAEWHVRWLPAALADIDNAVPERWCRPGVHDVFESTARRTSPRRTAGSHESTREGETWALSNDPTGPEHWDPWWRRAVRADLDQRRRAAAAIGPDDHASD